jgi:hypothetical protein
MHRRRRRAGVLPTVGLIVEGDTEFAALPLLQRLGLFRACPPMKPINMHGIGSDRLPAGIAKLLVPKVIQLDAGGYKKIIICIDREQRAECAPRFAAEVAMELRSELGRRGRNAGELHVVVADRTFEAWILAGAQALFESGRLAFEPGFGVFEGSLGEGNRKGVKELSRLLGRPYSKTVDGPRLFAALDFSSARMYPPAGHGSRSLNKFLRTLGI